MKPGPWVIFSLVLLVLSVVISVIDRSFLTRRIWEVLAIARHVRQRRKVVVAVARSRPSSVR